MNIKKKMNNLISIESVFKLLNIILIILDRIGLNEFFSLINRNKIIILWCHGISNRSVSFSARHLAKSDFEQQILYLKSKNYTFITLTELVEIMGRKKKLKKNYAIITFDDGFRNVIKNAYPLMKKYGAKGCIYVVTSLIGTNQLLWTDYVELLVRNSTEPYFNFKFKGKLYTYKFYTESDLRKVCNDIKLKLRSISNSERINHLQQFRIPNNIYSFKIIPPEYLIANWEELKSLDKDIIEVGSHTKTHPNLETITTNLEFERELKDSKNDLEKNLEYSINHLCYPAGSYNKKVMEHAKKYGYSTATTMEGGLNSYKTDLFQLKRIKMKNNFILFKARISGLFIFLKRIKNLFMPNLFPKGFNIKFLT